MSQTMPTKRKTDSDDAAVAKAAKIEAKAAKIKANKAALQAALHTSAQVPRVPEPCAPEPIDKSTDVSPSVPEPIVRFEQAPQVPGEIEAEPNDLEPMPIVRFEQALQVPGEIEAESTGDAASTALPPVAVEGVGAAPCTPVMKPQSSLVLADLESWSPRSRNEAAKEVLEAFHAAFAEVPFCGNLAPSSSDDYEYDIAGRFP